MPMDYTKLPADQHVTVLIGPSGGAVLGVTNTAVPLAAELNNTGGTSGMQKASASISWNDFAYGTESSETANEPSLADVSTYEEFTTANYGGSMSFYMPAAYDDNSNQHSVMYDLTDTPGDIVDVAVRIDGAKKTSTPVADGDFIHVSRSQVASEQNPFTPGESHRRTVGFNAYGDLAHYTVVGPHVLTRIGTGTFTAASTGRIRVAVQNRDYTNALSFRTGNGAIIDVAQGGFYKTGIAGSTTVTVEDKAAGTSIEIPVVVA